ncbi:ribonuclease E/G [Ruania zhangjianzhongii]|uniref:ribonuclease E/G n=1 Tax=Ruania zhangjianzhongii TaxID=2603206 RepID=UPI001FD07548|nr:ribonuclease E/G [Ruania zhangjianzhongii]
MSEEQNTAEAAAQDAQAQSAPRARRSRRATAPVTAPEPAATAPEPGATAPPETAAEQSGHTADSSAAGHEQGAAAESALVETPVQEAAAPARTTRSRRSSRPRRATAEASAPQSEPTGSDAATTSAAERDAGHPPADVADAVETAAQTTPPESADEPQNAKKRRRSTKAKAAEEMAPSLDVFAAFGVQPDTEPAPARDGSAEELAIDIDLPERETEDSDEDSTDETDEEESEDDAPRLPATALLFQAPDITGSRRRGPRSTGSEESGAQSTGATASQGDDSDGDAEDGGDGSTSTGDDSGSSGAGKRRRRRGGRGRRKSPGSGDGNDANDGDAAHDSDGTSGESSGSTAADEQSAKDAGKEPGKGGQAGKAEKKDTASAESSADSGGGDSTEESNGSSSRRRRRRRGGRGSRSENGGSGGDEVTALKGSTRLEAKRQRRKEGRNANRRRSVITEAEFLARRESVERSMVVRARDGKTQIAVLEDDVLVEHYVARKSQTSMVGNVYLGRVQNVLPSMEAAFVDLGKGRNAVLYAGEVNWDAAGLEGQPRRIEEALHSGDSILVQVTKDPIGHKGARLTAQVTLAGRYLVLVPSGAMTGISRKLPDTERARLKKLLKEIVPDGQGVIVRTAAEGASEEELRLDVDRLTKQWADIQTKVGRKSTSAPTLLKGEPELATRVVRDVFNEDFKSLVVSGVEAWRTISGYIESVAPDLTDRISEWTEEKDVFASHRIDEQLAKAMDRKVFLPSGGSLVIDRTEAMTVVDVNTGKFTGSGGTLEETVTRNNLEAAEEIVRQLRLRDIGGIIVIDFIDMVLEANRDLVLRRLTECLGRDRTRHQVAEVTSLGLVQMTRKRVGQGLVEAFSENCEHCNGRGIIVHSEPVESRSGGSEAGAGSDGSRSGRRRKSKSEAKATATPAEPEVDDEQRAQVKATLATIAAAAAHAHESEEAKVDAPPSPTAEGADTDGGRPATPAADEAVRTDDAAPAASSEPRGADQPQQAGPDQGAEARNEEPDQGADQARSAAPAQGADQAPSAAPDQASTPEAEPDQSTEEPAQNTESASAEQTSTGTS